MVSGRSHTDTSTPAGADLAAQENKSGQECERAVIGTITLGVRRWMEGQTVEEKARADWGIRLPTAKGTRGEPAKLMRAMTHQRIVHARLLFHYSCR